MQKFRRLCKLPFTPPFAIISPINALSTSISSFTALLYSRYGLAGTPLHKWQEEKKMFAVKKKTMLKGQEEKQ